MKMLTVIGEWCENGMRYGHLMTEDREDIFIAAARKEFENMIKKLLT